MRHEEQHPNRRDWQLVFLLGLPLGLLELGLFAVAATQPTALPLWNAAFFDWLLYFPHRLALSNTCFVGADGAKAGTPAGQDLSLRWSDAPVSCCAPPY